jgi:hypothetical protein
LYLYDFTDGITPTISIHPNLSVYDPTGAHVTGGGWINIDPAVCENPPEGANSKWCKTEANHGFIIKYNEDTGELEGQTTFSFKKGGFSFLSENAYDYIFFDGQTATFGGRGVITAGGTDSYAFFEVTVYDDDLNPNGGFGDDLFGFKLWLDNEEQIVIIDTGNTPNNPYPSGMLVSTGGSIVIH